MTFSFDICSKFVWVGAPICWALGGIYIFITSLDTVSALWDTTYQYWTGGHTKYTNIDQISRLILHFNSPRSFLLSVGQTKKITFHHLRTGEYGDGPLASQLEIFCWSTMLLGLLVMSLLASKAGITLAIRSILVLLMGPGVSPVEFSLQDLGIRSK